MFDTNLVIVGNVLTAPEWRRITSTGSLVANFRIASTARRFDRETGRWVDGNSLRVRVTAWRRLAEGVASSITVGDPVVVYGRLYSRDWKDEKDNNRDLVRDGGVLDRARPGAGPGEVLPHQERVQASASSRAAARTPTSAARCRFR